MQEYEQYDGLGLAALVRTGAVHPEELLEAAIVRIEATNPTLNAVVMPMFDAARASIRAGLPPGPFHGVPYLLKDLTLAVPGVRMRQGAVLFRDYVPHYEAEMVTRYRRAGLVLCGKTATSELGLPPTTESRLHGPTRNPWDLRCSPGGSSGGSAVAVAAGYTPAASAIDGGGSIRIPAAWCGLFGLKPTRARTPSGPEDGLPWAGLVCIHALSAALLDATHGADIGAPFIAPPPARPYLEEVRIPPGRLRMAMHATPFTHDAPLHPDCRSALEDAVQLCAGLGHSIAALHCDIAWEPVRQAARLIAATDARVRLEGRARQLGQALREADVEPLTWRLLETHKTASATDYLQALHVLYRTGRQFARAVQEYDVVITPTVPMPPVELPGMSPATPEGLVALQRATGFTQIANIAGHPAMSVPLCWNAAGLPVGIQFIGRYGDEATLFRLAGQLEEARPWFGRRPGVVRGT
jgi:Asp-tRNA(Asn)/Glu-tRNA(Gln) amidotransferase A subunit family amidase